MGKIRSGSTAEKPRQVQTAKEPADDKISFSFKYLQLSGNEKFVLDRCGNGYFPKFLERLIAINQYTIHDLQRSTSNALRFHPHDWTRTTEPNGFGFADSQLQSLQGWQFQISVNEHGRVHGFILGRTFYLFGSIRNIYFTNEGSFTG